MDVHFRYNAKGEKAALESVQILMNLLFILNFSFDRRLKVHSNGTLSVQAVTEKDAGDYLCITRNKVADDYRLLRVSVTTKPAKIEPRQPLNHMVSLGKTLKVGSHVCASLCVCVYTNIYTHTHSIYNIYTVYI